MKTIVSYSSVIENIFKFLIKTNTKFLFISGNGGSGKSTLSKRIKNYFEENGMKANLIDTDDFIINSTIRKSASISYLDTEGEEYKSSATSSFIESYCTNSMNAVLFNLKNEMNFYHIPKRATGEEDYILLNGKADIHIFEGVGTQFLNPPKNSLLLFIDCDVELEAKRRIQRARNGESMMSFEEVVKSCETRRTQLNSYATKTQSKYDFILTSLESFDFQVNKDVYNLLGGNMNKDCDFAIKVIKQASNLIVDNFEVFEKNNANDEVVTSIDLNIEKFIINKVKESYPDFDIVSEEYSPKKRLSANCVIINGIDGTVNLSKGMPIFGLQLAIVRNNVNTASAVYLPFLNELYYCDEEHSYLNGKRIVVSSCPVEKGLISATGTNRMNIMKKIDEYGLFLRDYGSIAVSFAWVSSGKLNAAIYTGDKIWNYYPVMKICERAGAKIINQKNLHIATSDEKFIKHIRKIMKEI